MIQERFVVLHSPKDPAKIERKNFSRKGTAFAYVKRWMPTCANGPMTIRHQYGGAAAQEASDILWTTLDTWVFHRDGRIEHIRA